MGDSWGLSRSKSPAGAMPGLRAAITGFFRAALLSDPAPSNMGRIWPRSSWCYSPRRFWHTPGHLLRGVFCWFSHNFPFPAPQLRSQGLLAARLLLFLLRPSLRSQAGKEPVAPRHGREGEDLPRQVGDEAGHLLAALVCAPGLEVKGHVPVEPGGQAAEGQAPLLPVQRPEQRLQETGSRGVQEGPVACRGRRDVLDPAVSPPGFSSRGFSLPGLQANMTAVLGGMRRYSEKLHGSGCPPSVSKNTPWSSVPPRQACGQNHGCWLPLLCSQRAPGVFRAPLWTCSTPRRALHPIPLPRPHVAPLQALPSPSIQARAQLC